MKKLLSLILAITMIAAFIPTVFAADGEATTVTYVFTQEGKGAKGNEMATIAKKTVDGVLTFDEEKINDEYKTTASSKKTGYWAYLGTNVKVAASQSAKNSDLPVMLHYSSKNFFLRTAFKETEKDDWVALKIKVPTDGNYKVTGATAYKYTRSSENINIFILPIDLTVDTTDEFNGKTLSEVFEEKSAIYGNISLGTNNYSVRSNAKKFSALGISSENQVKYKAASINTLGSVQLSSTTKSEDVLAYSNQQAIELDSDKEYVLLLHNATTDTRNMDINIESLTLTAEIENEPTNAPVELTGNINFAAGADIEYRIGEEQYAKLSANDVKSIQVGTKITVKANDVDNFAGWVRGTKDSKNWISDKSEYTFTLMSHTYLTPVYTEATGAEQVVEFWNENKEYLGTADVADGKATAPVATLTGHSFDAWHVSEETILPLDESGSVNVSDIADAIIRAVAKHNAEEDFGKAISKTNENATYWKRGNDIVAYGTSYDFYQWNGEPTITYGEEEITQNPIVVLDSTPVDGAYMIEYDKGSAAEIVEAGILFGSDDDIVINSTDGSKAASQRNDDHGQFCAKPNAKGSSTYARGYLIYRAADNKLYVIYTTAVATASAQ